MNVLKLLAIWVGFRIVAAAEVTRRRLVIRCVANAELLVGVAIIAALWSIVASVIGMIASSAIIGVVAATIIMGAFLHWL